MVIGHTQQPLVNQGDAIIHIAELLDPESTPATSTADSRPEPADVPATPEKETT